MKATRTYLAFFLLLALLPADAALAQCLRLTQLRHGNFEVFVRDPTSPTSEVLMVNNDPNTGAVAVANSPPTRRSPVRPSAPSSCGCPAPTMAMGTGPRIR